MNLHITGKIEFKVVCLLLIGFSVYFLRKLEVEVVSRVVQPHFDSSETSFNIQGTTFGFDYLIADCFWLRFIQIAGDPNFSQDKKAANCFDCLKKIVTLDPNFMPAFYFAAFVLGGDCHRPDLARQIILTAVNRGATDWNVFFIAGVNEYLFAKNPNAAADFYLQASKMAGAPSWLFAQVKVLRTSIPSELGDVRIWGQVYANAQDCRVKRDAKSHLCALWSEILRKAPTDKIRDRAQRMLRALDADGV